MAKRKNMMDMTPVCERCGKVAPDWTVYRTKEPCECGGKYTARVFFGDRGFPRAIRRPTMPDEYISREAALEITTRTCGDYAAAFAEIRKLPAADVAEVVRCKNCKWFADNNGGEWYGCQMFQVVQITPEDAPKPDDFCSYGEYQTNTGGVTK